MLITSSRIIHSTSVIEKELEVIRTEKRSVDNLIKELCGVEYYTTADFDLNEFWIWYVDTYLVLHGPGGKKEFIQVESNRSGSVSQTPNATLKQVIEQASRRCSEIRFNPLDWVFDENSNPRLNGWRKK